MSESSSVCSGLIEADTIVDTGRGLFRGVNVISGTIAIYDGTDNTGKLIYQGSSELGAPESPIRYTNGLYVDALTGTGTAVVYYG